MKQKYRNGTIAEADSGQDRLLKLFYGHAAGRLLLKPLIHPIVSELAGRLLSSGVSCLLIRPFIRKHHIDMDQFEPVKYKSYNEFFARRIRPGMRPADPDPGHLISPCDSKLTVYPIAEDSRFEIKHTVYTVASLLRDPELARTFTGGYLFLFRLTVDDYHRYIYAADGEKGPTVRIPGVYHTVNPIANDYFPVYRENVREYSILHSPMFGDMVMMEVGAMLVGRIVNHQERAEVVRGQEKGYFQFGGSTVILILKDGTVDVDEDILENSRAGWETIVKMGEKIGEKTGRVAGGFE